MQIDLIGPLAESQQQIVIPWLRLKSKASGLLVMQALHDEPDLRLKPKWVWSKRINTSHVFEVNCLYKH